VSTYLVTIVKNNFFRAELFYRVMKHQIIKFTMKLSKRKILAKSIPKTLQ